MARDERRATGGSTQTSCASKQARPSADNKHQPADLSETRDALHNEADELLDAIDDVLEENAQEFIQTYTQRGGE